MLPDCTERCLATELTADWTYAADTAVARPTDFAAVRVGVREKLLLARRLEKCRIKSSNMSFPKRCSSKHHETKFENKWRLLGR